MSKRVINISAEDFKILGSDGKYTEGDGTLEVVVEVYKDGDLDYVAYVSDPDKDGSYSKISGKLDVDGDGDHDEKDVASMSQLAKTFLLLTS
ncbi:hypothetical protein [Pseudomonas syringae group genomosp. 3]|uniref:hypothetical protein n=1 Tax=Pseudomonas syringae group genomosp. 3 TaxID=251701 RepID=UPI0007100157|nr:hypothetical protein [Pseudomonas syringae group genomosp. 3]